MPSKKNKSNNKKKPGANPAMLKMIKKQQELKAQEEERIRLEEEEERQREVEYQKQLELEEEEKKQKQENERLKKEQLKKEGKYMTKNQRKKLAQARARLPLYTTTSISKPKVEVNKTEDITETKINIDKNLRSPICCVLGHVDTGKTKLLDRIRRTNIQDKEVGGITQQIGASYFPIENIRQKTQELSGKMDFEYNIPGLLIIDTPGHESFSNLRHRGSSLCDIAVLVIDIMHGLEKQTIESINILKEKKIPFVIALNKIDRIYQWKPPGDTKDISLRESIKVQDKTSVDELEDRIKGIKGELSAQGLNTEICFKNHQMKKTYSLVPVSAITGEGIPDLLALMVFLTQKWMSRKLTVISELECSIMEVKTEEGLGTTVDVVLSNGILKEGDRIIVATTNGPVVTNIRALLTPQPLKEMRVKDQYIHHKEIKASMGIKIVANDLENVVAGTCLARIDSTDNSETINSKKDEVDSQIENTLNKIKCQEHGVFVKTSTLGSLEAFVSLLNDEKIPIKGVSIGPLHKKDITKASTNLTTNYPQYAVILAFNIKISKEMELLANKQGLKIIPGEIVYNIVDGYKKFSQTIKNKKKEVQKDQAIFPCVVEILGKKFIFNNKNPFVFGVRIISGNLRIGTPLIVPNKDIVLGRVTSIERDHKKIEIGKMGEEVCIKIETEDNSVTFGRQITDTETLYSNITRESIDCLKEFYRDEMTKDEWYLIIELKKILNIK
ncbi:Elongation factor Tu GTP binding domain [seawater metagenome]|uniref:Elongation factor Tu GTP binding domain n=1 Tax=seawater metagenome TaxID=1561972 RepID=A0A5E8CM74_9ZZZZ